MELESTGWEIAGASGTQVMAGTPIARIEIGGAHIVLPIKHTENNKLVTLKGLGTGFGLGASISVPFLNASYSHEDFPASRIGSIYQGLSRPDGDVYTESDFNGGVLVKTLTIGKQVSANVWSALWF